MNYSAPYTAEAPLAAQRYRTARVGSLTSPVPEEDVPDSPPSYGKQPSKRRLTICVVGSGGVGKSSLTVRYLNNHFPEVSEKKAIGGVARLILVFLFSFQFYDPTVGELLTIHTATIYTTTRLLMFTLQV